ncbi:MAG: thiamine ABC transporter ATP-binding protein [Pseudomonadota bacterium]
MRITFDAVRLSRPGFALTADWSVASGASVAILGPSGAGKSTLLSLLAGFETPSSGWIKIGGQDVTDLHPADRPVAMLFQDNNLFPHLTITQNVGLGRNPALRLTAADKASVVEVLERVGLEGKADQRPSELSGGQQSRAALARALLRDRPILLLDEPFSALGPALRRDMLDLVSEIRAEHQMTLLMVTHDPADAERIAEQIAFVDGGLASAPAPTKALLAKPPPALAAYLGV